MLDYPNGKLDKFEYCILKKDDTPKWVEVVLQGTWFPYAFVGSMSSLMHYAEGSTNELPTSVEYVALSMAVVEAAYKSHEEGGTIVDYNI